MHEQVERTRHGFPLTFWNRNCLFLNARVCLCKSEPTICAVVAYASHSAGQLWLDNAICKRKAARRRRELENTARAIFDEFEGRVLAFETEAAHEYAGLFARRRQAGRPAAVHDLMIAAIASAHGAGMVTRDIRGFEGCGLTLINPWEAK